jgi:hypothetical protein
MKLKYTLCGQNAELCELKQILHVVTTGLHRINSNFKIGVRRCEIRLRYRVPTCEFVAIQRSPLDLFSSIN